MWDDARRLNAATLLFAGAAAVMLLWGGIAWAVRQPAFAIRQVSLDGPLYRANPAHVAAVIREELRGTFFTLRLADARASLQRVPWVKSVALRRRWPDRLEVTVIEHEVLARWNENALVDTEGEAFSADFDGELPQLTGPEGSAALVAARFRDFGAALATRALAISELQLSARGSWRLKTTGNPSLTIDLGRNAPDERLSRFVAYYARTLGALARAGTRVHYVDLRYRNGFAARVPGFSEKTPQKGTRGSW
jgi:cell division protein FtsQ